MFLHPSVDAQLFDLSPLQAPGMTVVDVFQSGGNLELGGFDPSGHPPVFFPKPLSFDQKRQAVFKVQLADVLLAALFL
jgi:hypothetical protein